jgi:hypothetical protein
MAVRPNFLGVERKDDTLIVSGKSEEIDEILEIRVSLSQLDRDAPQPVRVTKIGDPWEAVFPAAALATGPVVAFGIEMRNVNSTTTTWAELLTIP